MILFTDGDLANIVQIGEHSLALVELQARFGGEEERAYFVQRRAAVASLQAKAEQELQRRRVEAQRAKEAEEAKREEDDDARIEAEEAKLRGVADTESRVEEANVPPKGA